MDILHRVYNNDPTLTVLAVHDWMCEGNFLCGLFECLKYNTTIVELYFYFVKFTNNEFLQLTNMLKTCSFLKLVFSRNDLNDNHVEQIIKSLKTNRSLKELHLTNNNITSKGALYIADFLKLSSLSTISLIYNKIGNEGIKLLSESISENDNLKKFLISGNDFNFLGVKDLVSNLSKNNVLECLNIGNNYLGDIGAQYIVELLRVNQSIKHIYLHNNNIGDTGVMYLSEVLKKSKIRQLSLVDNNIGDIGLQYLTDSLIQNNELSELYLSYNHFGMIGISKLSEALIKNNSLKRLTLTHCKLGSSHIKSLFQALTVNNSLNVLNLSYNDFGSSGSFKNFPQFNLQKFKIDGCNIDNNDIQDLCLSLKNNKSLTSLSIHNNNIGDNGALHLSEVVDNTFLKKLNVSNNEISKYGRILLGLSNLNKLNMAFNKI